MMRRILIFFLVSIIFSCNKEEPNLVVTGQINGLKKGTIYLERLQDTVLIKLDSMLVNGEPEFVLHTRIDEPEVLYLSLVTNNAFNEIPRITFFAEEGTTTIHTTLRRFNHDARIEGSKHQKLLEEYNKMINQFTNKNLEFIKAEFDVRADSLKVDSVQRQVESLIKRKYLYTVNFVINNKTSPIAPYIALSEIYDVNIKYLDTMYQVLPDSIANSRYGRQLANYIKELKSDSIQ